MYFKLALRNVKKSYKDYLIYFLTIAFSVCLFYTFNSFQDQQAVLVINDIQSETLQQLADIMNYLSLFIALVLGFLILYANNFLIKRRKKELGLYTLLGMPKSKISRVLVMETFLIGLCSLLTGIIFGLLLSQLMCALTASLFAIPLDYHFIYSSKATFLTIVSFSIIFLILMIFNTFILNKYKLIDLLRANEVSEDIKIKNIYVSFFLFILSVILLGADYYFVWTKGILALNYLIIVLPVGLLGTFLFFASLSGFLLKFIQTSKRLYYRNLNMFVLRQVNSSINSNFISMSFVCIMLLLSIGALSSGLNANAAFNDSIKLTTPYDYTFVQGEETLDTIITDFNIDAEVYIEDNYVLTTYQSGLNFDSLLHYLDPNERDVIFNTTNAINVIKLSDFNRLRKAFDLDSIQLSDHEAYMYSSADYPSEIINPLLKKKPMLSMFGDNFQVCNDSYERVNIGTIPTTEMLPYGVVVADERIPENASIDFAAWNVNLKEGIRADEFDRYVHDQLAIYREKTQPDEAKSKYDSIFWSSSIDDVYAMSRGNSVTFTYVGLYLGFVFLLSSAVVLALQQLSQASDNKRRYLVLNKIGVEKRMLNKSILLQLGIYFLVPLLLAIVHSVVGIQFVNNLILLYGRSDIFMASLITGGIITLIYGAYFITTYIGYKNIIRQK